MAETDPESWDRATEEERQEVFAAHLAFDRAVRERAALLAGEALAGVGTALTLERAAPDGSRAVREGPYAETVEQLGGFYLVEAGDPATVVDLCRLLPGGYTVEVRPVLHLEGFDPQ
jgi:hypothetical protein